MSQGTDDSSARDQAVADGVVRGIASDDMAVASTLFAHRGGRDMDASPAECRDERSPATYLVMCMTA